MRETRAVRNFILEKRQIGEYHIAAEQIEEGVDHLTNAAAVLDQRQPLLQLLRSTLPPEVFQMFLLQLAHIASIYIYLEQHKYLS